MIIAAGRYRLRHDLGWLGSRWSLDPSRGRRILLDDNYFRCLWRGRWRWSSRDNRGGSWGRCSGGLACRLSAIPAFRDRIQAIYQLDIVALGFFLGAFQFRQLISQEANLILLGMLADACDERLLLTRFFDKEALKLEDLPDRGTWSV